MTEELPEVHGQMHEAGGHDPVAGIVPVGGIIMWSGAVDQVPEHWKLCDGENGTPDLTDRFVVGAGGDTWPVAGSTGGASQATATITVPKHNTFTYRWSPDSGIGHQLVGYGAETHSPASSTFSILPPFYALAYIMRVT